MIRITGLLFWIAVAACAPLAEVVTPPGTRPAPGAAEPRPADAEAARFAERLNERRALDGCPRLVWDDAVAAVAASHSRDMARREYFGHTSPEGVGPFDRLRAAGIAFTAAAENIARGPATGDAVFEGWLASSGHRENMLDCRFTRQGVARHGGYWTQVLIRPPS
jgi:uncharacterized protein YkwD